jgi:hypothetical protein
MLKNNDEKQKRGEGRCAVLPTLCVSAVRDDVQKSLKR